MNEFLAILITLVFGFIVAIIALIYAMAENK